MLSPELEKRFPRLAGEVQRSLLHEDQGFAFCRLKLAGIPVASARLHHTCENGNVIITVWGVGKEIYITGEDFSAPPRYRTCSSCPVAKSHGKIPR